MISGFYSEGNIDTTLRDFWCAAGNILITRVMDYFHEYISMATDMALVVKYQFF